MQDSFILDETDRALVNVLQLAPRASWTVVGQVLGTNPATANRRWQRIAGEGLARVIAYPQPSAWAHQRCMAFVEVDCEPVTRQQVVEALARVPQVASISVPSSGRDLFLTVFTVDLAALSDFVLGQLNRLQVRRTRTHMVTRLFSQGNKWTLDTLDRARRAHLVRSAPRHEANGHAVPAADRAFLLALDDGRRTFAEIAERTSTSVATARRRLGRMIREETVSFRCETAQPITGWPVAASFWARVPPDELDRIARTLVSLREIRMCAAVTGSDNLVITLWLRSLADSQRFEAELARQLPAVVLTDRTITLHAVKRMGCLLDEAGRSTCVIPVDPWAAPTIEP